MAGVNLNEESARILATNSELVGTHIRSCKDEAFLHPGLLHRRILETGKTAHTWGHTSLLKLQPLRCKAVVVAANDAALRLHSPTSKAGKKSSL